MLCNLSLLIIALAGFFWTSKQFLNAIEQQELMELRINYPKIIIWLLSLAFIISYLLTELPVLVGLS